MSGVGIWRGWDGRCLRWRMPAAGELRLDGARFERVAEGEGERDFAFPPGGGTELEFSLHGGDGALCAPVWRVRNGQASMPGADVWQGTTHALQALADASLPPLDARLPDVTIVVPVYNSPQSVQRCIAALLRYTGAGARLILIDDASTDPAIAPLLARFAGGAGVSVLRNPLNLGYTATCNRGIELAGTADVVLLNADTQVGPRWLERLRLIAHADATIGTVTAVSDNAGAFSVPELEQHCPIPSRWSLAQTQRALLQHCGGCLPQLPTGNGFCMYVKRVLFDRVGLLDVAAFPAGYGEENDLCQRAEHVGLRHVIAGDVLVQHERSVSFGAERRATLGAQGMAVLRQRYPDYETKVGATLHSFERCVLDWRVRRLYAGTDGHYVEHAPRPRIVADEAGAGMDDGFVECLRPDCAEPSALRAWLVHHAIEAVQTQSPSLARAAAGAGVPVFDAAGMEHWVANTRRLA